MSKKTRIIKEELTKLYVEQDKTTYEIASIYSCDRRTISRYLKQYGITIKRHKRAYSFYYEQKLNDIQKDLILGSLIGDGCISKHHDGVNSCRFLEQHSIRQLEYLKWKKEILNNFVSSDIKIIDNSKNNSYGNELSCNFITVLHKEFVKFYEMFYKNKVKRIPYFQLSPISLAVWYFDDGSISKLGQKGNYYSARFHTESYDDESIANLQKMLKDMDISSNTINVKKKYKIISLPHIETNKLMNIIAQYANSIPCMAYKIKFSDNPVETQAFMSGVPILKCFGANTHDSLFSFRDDGIVRGSRKG